MKSGEIRMLIKALTKYYKGNASIAIFLVLLAKLVYFNTQIGAGSFNTIQILSSIGSLLLLTTGGLLLRPKAAIWYMGILNILATLIIFSNIVFYRYFNDLISIPLLFQVSSLGDVQSSMLQLMHWKDLLLVGDSLLLPLIIKASIKGEENEISIKIKLIGTVGCCTAGAFAVLMGFSQLSEGQPTILQTFYDRVYVAQNIGLLNYHAADFYTYMQQSREEDQVLDLLKQEELYKFFEAKGQEGEEAKELFAAGKDKNLIIIQAEALQQFVINAEINGAEITPNLNRLAKSGIYFDNIYYQTASGGTSDAEFTTLVSMFPMKEGAVYIRKPGNYFYSLPRKLKENGYSAAAMHGYKPGFWNRSVVYKNIGFDEFYSMSNMDQSEWLGMGISDKSFFRQAVEKLEKLQ